MSPRLTQHQADEIEAEMRRLEADPSVTKNELRLFMQAPMPCGHSAGCLLTCDEPPFGCVECGQPERPPSGERPLPDAAEEERARRRVWEAIQGLRSRSLAGPPEVELVTRRLDEYVQAVRRATERSRAGEPPPDERAKFSAEEERLVRQLAAHFGFGSPPPGRDGYPKDATEAYQIIRGYVVALRAAAPGASPAEPSDAVIRAALDATYPSHVQEEMQSHELDKGGRLWEDKRRELRDRGCPKPPEGWRCTRATGHPGPCAALRVGPGASPPPDAMRKALQEVADLDAEACMFDMCDGPDAPFVGMKTCRVCAAIQGARVALRAPREEARDYD